MCLIFLLACSVHFVRGRFGWLLWDCVELAQNRRRTKCTEHVSEKIRSSKNIRTLHSPDTMLFAPTVFFFGGGGEFLLVFFFNLVLSACFWGPSFCTSVCSSVFVALLVFSSMFLLFDFFSGCNMFFFGGGTSYMFVQIIAVIISLLALPPIARMLFSLLFLW